MSNTGSTVATITAGANTQNPTIVINSVGTFNIVATVSSSINYTETTIPSLPIQVYGDTPNIVFSSSVTEQSLYTYDYGVPYEYTGGAATITNNTGQTLIYSIVTADSTTTSLTPSTVATIDKTGWYLNTISCDTNGMSSFKICATAMATSNGDFDSNVALSQTLTIIKATPKILQYPQINLTGSTTDSTLVYGQQYTITPDPSQISTITSNTDTNPPPNINYTSSDNTIAKISGTTVTIVGIGHFQILVTVSPTTNYNQILRSPSPQIYNTIQAIPTITSFPTIPQSFVYAATPFTIPSTITTTNNDNPGPIISYSSSNSNAIIAGNTITVTGIGSFQILVTIHATQHFSEKIYTYPSPTTYYQTLPATPTITFSSSFNTTSRYGSTYVFVPPILSNNDPSQSLTYSIYPTNSTVASIVYAPYVKNPSFVINSVGTFQIQASCQASTNGYYNAVPWGQALSPIITIAKEIPIIVFNTSKFSNQYTCLPTSSTTFSAPIASITNNKVQTLTYSIVATDGITPSNIATISSDGTSFVTKNVGSFCFLATATATSDGDYGSATQASQIIKIISGTPIITNFPTIPTNLIYGNSYTIPSTITTSNTDTPGPVISYSIINQNNTQIATISNMNITIIGVGNFQISVTIGSTTNYNSATYLYPSPTTYYTSTQATPIITLPSNFGSGWVIGGTYNLTSNITSNTLSQYNDTNKVNYSMNYSMVSNNINNSNNAVKMVAVSNSSSAPNTIAYSYDGINWTGLGYSFVLYGANSVAWNGNMWVIGSLTPPYIVYSFNGINWFIADHIGNIGNILNTVYGVASNGSIWLAIGTGLNRGVTIAYSYDGIYWYASNNSSSITISGYAAAWNGSMWIAGGVGMGSSGAAYSYDGINWNALSSLSSLFSQTVMDIAWNGSIWVAVGQGNNNTIAYSSDGINWTGVTNSSSSILSTIGNSVAWNGSIWVAVGQGNNNTIAYSSDGMNWTGSSNGQSIITSIGFGIAWNGIGGRWVAVGEGSDPIAYSYDGINWGEIPDSNGVFGNYVVTAIASITLIPNTMASIQHRIVALGNVTNGGNSIVYSNDGMNWAGTNASTIIFSVTGNDVAWNGSMWVAVGQGTNTIACSIDGIYWFPSGSSLFSSGNGIAWNGSMWVAVGSGTNTIAYSSDGMTWTSNGMIFSISGNDVAWNGSMWVAVGSGGNSIFYSNNGTTWNAANNSIGIFTTQGNGIAWNGSIWVAVGQGSNNTIAWSTDGINWTGATNSVNGSNSTSIFSSSGNAIAWNQSMWIAVGNGTTNTIAYSYDGKRWTGLGNSLFTVYGTDVTWYNASNMWVATGKGGQSSIGNSASIVYSKDGINWYPVNNTASIFPGDGNYGIGVGSNSGIVYYTNQGNTNYNIATITSSGSNSQITINDVGSFQIQATLPATNNFLSALPVISNIITITPGTVSLTSNNFSNFVYGQTYTLLVTTNNTDIPPPFITYKIFPQGGSTGNGTINGSSLTTTAIGGAYIYVDITATQNFNSASIPVFVNIAQATPNLVLNTYWVNAVQYSFYIGSQFAVSGLISSNSNTDSGLTYSYGFTSNIVSLAGTVVICNSPGLFQVTVTSNATTNFTAVSATTSPIYISVVPEVIIFNNPQTYPPSGGTSGEVGMAICITNDSYPYGFNNYSQLTITNVSQGNATFTINANTTPNYLNMIRQYMVFFEPNTAGSFSGALSTSVAGNIGYVGVNSIASGMAFGQNLTFTFSGNTTGINCPDPFTISWNPGSLDLTQGLGYVAFYTLANGITTNTPSGNGVSYGVLNNYSGISGWYQFPWAGYDTLSTTGGVSGATGYSSVAQAWGVWFNPNYYTNTYGGTISYNNSNFYYVGLPQITNPLTPLI